MPMPMPMPMLRFQCQDFQIAPEKSHNSWKIKPKNFFCWVEIATMAQKVIHKFSHSL